MELLEKHRWVWPIAFAISCVFVFGGSVNLGSTDFFAAIPFLGFVLWTCYRKRSWYIAATVLLAAICIPLYVIKDQNSPLFYPALGQEFVLDQDVCLLYYDTHGSQFVLADQPRGKGVCGDTNAEGVKAWRYEQKGLKLKVAAIKVANADFGEDYQIRTETALGQWSIPHINTGNLKLKWLNGEPVKAEHLRRKIFYYPSNLMLWPMFPLVIKTVYDEALQGRLLCWMGIPGDNCAGLNLP